MRERDVFTSLRRRAEFSRVHTQGRRQGDALLQVRVLPCPAAKLAECGSLIRLGIIASKKFGSAVERNRFKRIVRAAVRALASDLTPGWDILVLPRAAHEAGMPQLQTSLRNLLGALGVLRGEDSQPEGKASS